MQIKSGKTHAGDANTSWNFFFQQNWAVCRNTKFQGLFCMTLKNSKRHRKHEIRKGPEKEFIFSTYQKLSNLYVLINMKTKFAFAERQCILQSREDETPLKINEVPRKKLLSRMTETNHYIFATFR